MRFDELVEFKKANGHCNVPTSYKKVNRSLSIWVQGMRRKYKLYKEEGQHSQMTEERIAKLESIGFVWKPKEAEKAKRRNK